MTGTTPRRRHSPGVYRRRRLVLLIAVLAVVAGVVWLLVAQPWRGEAAEGPSTPETTKSQDAASTLPVPSADPTPAATGDADADAGSGTAATPTPTPSSTPVAEPCVARDIAVEAVTDHESYSADQNPAFSIRLTNNASADCTLNVGTSGQAFIVTSGSDTWWRSTDCQSEPSDMVVLLEAGQSVSSAAPLVWDRTRSAVGTCGDETRPRAPGGGSSYHLVVEIGGIASMQSTQFLLY